MKLFNIGLPGQTQHLFVAKDKEDAYERRAEVDHTFEYLPVVIEEVTVEGYEIKLVKAKPKPVEEPVQPVEVKNDEPPESVENSQSK